MSRFWDHHAQTIDLARFRANDQYLWQPEHYPYERLVQEIHSMGRERMIPLLGEDGSFGCVTREVMGLTVSRDLLDSILEIAFLEETLPRFGTRSVLDIGAGYGRFAWRLNQAHPELVVDCIDTVSVSRQACELYRDFRRGRWGVYADTAKVLECARPAYDLAINVHSWSECTGEEIRGWMRRLRHARVPYLFVIPHEKTFSTKDAYDAGTTQRDGKGGGEFRSIIEEHGYLCVARREPWFDGRNYYLFKLGAA